MGQEVRGVPEASALGGSEAPGGDAAIGAYLARQRRLRGISLEELCVRTRIPRRSLERLEAGAFDHAADGFTRGFVRTVAAALGLDPDEAVMRLLGEPADEDEERRTRDRARRRTAVLAAAVTLAAVGIGLATWGLRAALRPAPEVPGEADAGVVYRRDAVRQLVDEP